MATASSQAAAGLAPRGRLLRIFGTPFALAIAVGGTVGGGILHSPGEIAALLPSAWWIMGLWAFGAFNSWLGATAFCELGTMMPDAGGPYVYVRRAFGDFAGFFVGYVNWIEECAVAAAVALLVAEYSDGLWPAMTLHHELAALVILTVLVALQWSQARRGGTVQTLSTFAKVLGLGALVVAAYTLPASSSPAVPVLPFPRGAALATAIALAMQGVIFTYNGYQYPIYFAEELRDPGREIPRSMFRGLALITAIYLLLNAAFLHVIPVARLAHDPFVGGTLARDLLGAYGDPLIRAVVVVSLVGIVNCNLMSTPRVLLAMGRDRLFLRQAIHVNPGGTPTVGLLLTTLAAFAFLLSGTFSAALDITAVLMVVQYLLMFVAVIALRRREPQALRPYRTWGYPWPTVAGLLIGVAFLVGVAIGDLRHSAIAFAVVLVSYPLFRVVSVHRRRGAP